jgi:hypothetical protein
VYPSIVIWTLHTPFDDGVAWLQCQVVPLRYAPIDVPGAEIEFLVDLRVHRAPGDVRHYMLEQEDTPISDLGLVYEAIELKQFLIDNPFYSYMNSFYSRPNIE